ncbi:CLUMA_CG007829, isoform A [Clunio marinus]|uniref:CLUMA_CG007829, isoform A n=1 Tax=Clunio marinus TaxID=568069 RepID=A0A1J1I3H1_9DIPT|nr:CLUMA_CG007829, isoform A [Clunio marinus]
MKTFWIDEYLIDFIAKRLCLYSVLMLTVQGELLIHVAIARNGTSNSTTGNIKKCYTLIVVHIDCVDFEQLKIEDSKIV